MGYPVVLVDLPENRGLVVDDVLLNGHGCTRLTSSVKDNSVPGRRHTATLISSGAEKPRRAKGKLVGGQLVPNFCGARFDCMKAEITHRVHSYIAPGPGEAYAFPWRGASGR